MGRHFVWLLILLFIFEKPQSVQVLIILAYLLFKLRPHQQMRFIHMFNFELVFQFLLLQVIISHIEPKLDLLKFIGLILDIFLNVFNVLLALLDLVCCFSHFFDMLLNHNIFSLLSVMIECLSNFKLLEVLYNSSEIVYFVLELSLVLLIYDLLEVLLILVMYFILKTFIIHIAFEVVERSLFV